MALAKSKLYIHGLSVEYWMIGKIIQSKVANQTTVYLYPYISREAREADINDYVEELIIVVASIPGYNLTYTEIYAYIHQSDSWMADAMDV